MAKGKGSVVGYSLARAGREDVIDGPGDDVLCGGFSHTEGTKMGSTARNLPALRVAQFFDGKGALGLDNEVGPNPNPTFVSPGAISSTRRAYSRGNRVSMSR